MGRGNALGVVDDGTGMLSLSGADRDWLNGVIGGAEGRLSRMSNRSGTPSEADLVTLNRAAVLARMMSSVVHEFNNALQMIGGTAELLQGTPGLPESVVRGLTRVQEQNARAAGSISEVVAFARQKPDARGRVNLLATATRALRLRSYAIARAKLTSAVDAPSDGRFFVEGIASMIELAAINLIVNAEQALAGRPGGAIRVSLETRGGEVILRVADNGPGVTAALTDRIFEPFFTTRPRDESSGLGLTVARLVAAQHGGTLTLEDNGTGASFALCLPGTT